MTQLNTPRLRSYLVQTHSTIAAEQNLVNNDYSSDRAPVALGAFLGSIVFAVLALLSNMIG